MKRYALLILAVFLTMSAVPLAASAQTADDSGDKSVVRVSTDTFTARPAVRMSTLIGFTRARSSMTLVAEESGRVETVLADVGDALGEDGHFAELDKTFIKLNLDNNRVDQRRLKSDYEYYRKEMNRYTKLVKTKNAAQSTLDANVRAFRTAVQQLKAVQIQEKVLVERMERFSLIGPPGWKVITRHIEPGEWVNTGEPVAELGRYDVLLVPYSLTSREYEELMHMEGKLTLLLTDLNKTVEATVARVSPGFDSKSRKINVDLEITEGDFEFRGGLRTELTLHLSDPGGAILVPQSSLVKAYEEYFLMTPDKKRVRVMLLGSAKGNLRRVSSPDVKSGDKFLVAP